MFIKRPNKSRTSYALIGTNGKTVHDSRIENVNRDLRLGMARDVLEQRMSLIRDSLRPRKLEIADTNAKVIEDLHRSKVKRKPLNVDNDNYKYPLLRAGVILGNTSLHTATEDELLDCLSKEKDQHKRYRHMKAINELLTFLTRDFRLFNPKPPRPDEIVFIRAVEFIAKMSNIGNPEWATYMGGLFATGCRLGELPVVHYRGTKAVDVKLQIDHNGVKRRTKNKKQRTAPILPILNQFIERLQAIGMKRLTEIRLTEHKPMLKACREVYGIKLHDFRHSYAVEWGAAGANTLQIADYIGDTPAVTKDHYMSYCATDDAIDRALALFIPHKV